jgi:hypothetical protein
LVVPFLPFWTAATVCVGRLCLDALTAAMDLQVELSVYDKANLLMIASPELPSLINVTYLSPLA